MNPSEQATQYPLNAAELREAFDRVFAAAEMNRTTDRVDFLSIRVGARPFAFRLTELTRIEALGKLVALPGAHPWLLGLTSSLGKLVPVYSLELALGFERTGDSEKWLALLGGEELLGLAFDSLEGYLRIPKVQIYSTGNGQVVGQQETINTEQELRPVINVQDILSRIRKEHHSGGLATDYRLRDCKIL